MEDNSAANDFVCLSTDLFRLRQSYRTDPNLTRTTFARTLSHTNDIGDGSRWIRISLFNVYSVSYQNFNVTECQQKCCVRKSNIQSVVQRSAKMPLSITHKNLKILIVDFISLFFAAKSNSCRNGSYLPIGARWENKYRIFLLDYDVFFVSRDRKKCE